VYAGKRSHAQKRTAYPGRGIAIFGEDTKCIKKQAIGENRQKMDLKEGKPTKREEQKETTKKKSAT